VGKLEREPHWSEAVAAGRRSFVERVRDEFGSYAQYRHVENVNGVSVLRECETAYTAHSMRKIERLGAVSGRSSG